MQSTIEHLSRRTRRYWLIDGLAEITLGCMFLFLGMFLCATVMIPKGPVQGAILALGLPVLIIGLGRVSNRIVRNIRTQLTYPRTGYVAYQKPSGRRRWITFGAGAVLTAVLISLIILKGVDIQDWIPLLNGLLLGIILLFMGQGLKRFYLLSAVSVSIGLLLSANRIGGNLGHGAFYGLIGLALLASGCMTLILYLREHQEPGEEMR